MITSDALISIQSPLTPREAGFNTCRTAPGFGIHQKGLVELAQLTGVVRVSRHGWDRADLKCTEGRVEHVTTLVLPWDKRPPRLQSLHFCRVMALARDPGERAF